MFTKLALKNLRQILSRMPIFLMSVAFAIMVDFSFFVIGTDDSLASKINSQFTVTSVGISDTLLSMHGFIIFFLVLFLLYSNNFFMKKRKRDISVLLLQGFSKLQISLYFMVQEFLMGLVLLVLGLFLGTIFVRLIYMFFLKIVGLQFTLAVGVSLSDFTHYFLIFIGLMFFMFLNTIYHVSKTQPNFRDDANRRLVVSSPKKFFKHCFGILSVIILVIDFYIIIFELPQQSMSNDLSVIGLLLIVFGGPFGVLGLFRWVFPDFVDLFKKIHFVSDNQLIWLSNAKNSFHQSSFILTLISVISILALFIFMVLSYAYPYRQEEVKIDSPTALSVNSNYQKEFDDIVTKSKIQLTPLVLVNVKSVNYGDRGQSFIDVDSYNASWQTAAVKVPKVTLKQNQALFLGENQHNSQAYRQAKKDLTKGNLDNNVPVLSLKDTSPYFPLGRVMYIGGCFVVSKKVFNQIKADYSYAIQNYDFKNGGGASGTSLNKKFDQLVEDRVIAGTNTLYFSASNGEIIVSKNSADNQIGMMQVINYAGPSNLVFKQSIGLIAFILVFLGILLILSSGNLLLLRVQGVLYDNLPDFKTYRKLGATKAEILLILRNQTLVFYFAPMTVAILTVWSFMPLMNSLGIFESNNSILLFGGVMVGYVLLNLIFYFVAYRDFSHLIYSSVFERRSNQWK